MNPYKIDIDTEIDFKMADDLSVQFRKSLLKLICIRQELKILESPEKLFG